MGTGVWITRTYPNGATLEAESFAELKRMEAEYEAINSAYLASTKANRERPKTMLARLRQWAGR